MNKKDILKGMVAGAGLAFLIIGLYVVATNPQEEGLATVVEQEREKRNAKEQEEKKASIKHEDIDTVEYRKDGKLLLHNEKLPEVKKNAFFSSTGVALNNEEEIKSLKGEYYIYFYLDQCEYCYKGESLLKILTEKYNKKIYAFKADNSLSTATNMGVQAYPTLMRFKDGVEVERLVGNIDVAPDSFFDLQSKSE